MTVLERVPLDAITAQARDVRPGRVLLTVIAALFFAVGWIAGRMFLAAVWCAVAVKVGYQAGAVHGGPARAD